MLSRGIRVTLVPGHVMSRHGSCRKFNEAINSTTVGCGDHVGSPTLKSSQIRAPNVVPQRSTGLAQLLTSFGVKCDRNECNMYTPGIFQPRVHVPVKRLKDARVRFSLSPAASTRGRKQIRVRSDHHLVD